MSSEHESARPAGDDNRIEKKWEFETGADLPACDGCDRLITPEDAYIVTETDETNCLDCHAPYLRDVFRPVFFPTKESA